MKRFRTGIVALCSSLMLAGGCAATPPAADASTLEERLALRGFTRGEAVPQIHNFRVSDWRYLDPEHVIVGAGPSQDFLLVLMTRCQGLSTTEDLGFTTTAGSLTTLDKVVIKTSIGPEQCPVKEIRKLEKVAKGAERPK